MHKRVLAITLVATALLFSQGGSFLVAALCPHKQSGVESCTSQSAEPKMSHEDMGHMGHQQMEHEPDAQPNTDTAFEQPIDLCPHCAIHSGAAPNIASLREKEVAKRSFNLSTPLHAPKVVPVSASAVSVPNSRAHGPPGNSMPRHILINSFRI